MIENKKIFYIRNKLHCVYYYEKRAHILGALAVRLLGKTSAKGENRRCFANEFFTCFCAKEMFISQNVQIKCLLCKNHALFSSWKRASA